MRYKTTCARVVLCGIAMWLFLCSLQYCYAQETGATLEIVKSGTATMNVTVRKISDNQPHTGDITWTASSSTEKWVYANYYIEVSYSDLPQFWGIQMYTDNKSATANPQYTGTGNPAGLVNTVYRDRILPMAWLVTDKVLTQTERNDAGTYKPEDAYRADEDRIGFDNYMWHHFLDKNTVDDESTPTIDESFANAKDYIVIWNQSGAAWHEASRQGRPQKVYIYLITNFTSAYAGGIYKTSKLTLELYHGVDPFPLYVYKDAPKTDPAHEDDPDATFANHYAPTFMNYKSASPNITYSDHEPSARNGNDNHSLKVRWNGTTGSDGYRWAGVMWLEPNPGSGPWYTGPNYGYDLRGVQHLRFWAKANISGASINAFFGLNADANGPGDSCLRTPPYDLWRPLNTTWTEYIIPVSLSTTENMSYVSGGFGIVFNDTHDGAPGSPGYTVYLDDVRFETGP